jgi:sterol 3beta-glucosyltransferase
VYVGFGPVPFRDPERAIAVVTEALSRAGQRGVIPQASLPRDAELPREIFAIDSVWHDWLFPRLNAAVHHGGAGTTGAVLRAGLPSVVIPAIDDQPFWASRIHDLGVGPPPIHRKRLSVERLAHAIRIATTDAGMRARAGALAERIQSEDGVARAVEAFERHTVAGEQQQRSVTHSG